MVQAVQCTDRAKSLGCRDQLVLPMQQKSVETCSTSSQMPVQERSSDLKHSHIVHGACMHIYYKSSVIITLMSPKLAVPLLKSGGLANDNTRAFALTRQMDIHVGLEKKLNDTCGNLVVSYESPTYI